MRLHSPSRPSTAERKPLIREIHHRVKNSLQVVSSSRTICTASPPTFPRLSIPPIASISISRLTRSASA
ncbi:MAG: histidine kinase dimerization/phosphoacceptor domain -containing protein [Spirochaetota bacterium]